MYLPREAVAKEIRLQKKTRLNPLYRRAAKLILPNRSLSTTAGLTLDILPLQEQFMYSTAVLMFKVHSSWAPQYVCPAR